MISINFSINTFVCLSASLKGIMRTFKRCRRTSRIGNEYLRSFSVFIRMIINLQIKTLPVFYATTVSRIAYENECIPRSYLYVFVNDLSNIINAINRILLYYGMIMYHMLPRCSVNPLVVIGPTTHFLASQSHPFSASSIIVGHRVW